MKKHYKWEDLLPSTQKRLAAQGDPRVPKDYVRRPVGRPKGSPATPEARRKLSLHYMSDPVRRAQRVAEAVRVLLLAYGDVDGIIKALRGQ